MPTKTGSDDAILLRQAQAGDPDAFGTLYEKYAPAIFRYLFSRLSDRWEAEDLTEDVFVQAWKRLPSYQDRGHPFSSYLFRIARNLVISVYRKNGRPPAGLERELKPALNPAEVIEERMQHAALYAALETLPEHYREVLRLRFFGGLAADEVGLVMGRSAGAVRILQFRALIALRGAMVDA